MVMAHRTPDPMTLHDHIAAIDGALHQLDGMPKADIRDLAERLAVLSDLVAGVANGRDAAIDAMLRTAKRQGRLRPVATAGSPMPWTRIEDYLS